MSEYAPPSPEQHEHNPVETLEQLRQELESRPELTEHASPEKAQERLETARTDVEAAAEQSSIDKVREALNEAEKPTEGTAPAYTNRELRTKGLREEMKRIQQREKLPVRNFSKLVHQPVIRAVSDVTAKSVSRPSGLLGGGLMAFVGTSAYVYFTRHIGLRYNYFLFIAFFVAGFAVGLVLEFVLWAAGGRKHSPNS